MGDTRATVIVFYGNRVDDIRIQGEVVNTLQARMGTGGGNMPLVVAPTLSASNNPSRSPQSSEITAQVEAVERATSIVRRLTPTECEALQGFPRNWTDGQSDVHRYKQMGNAVAVPVVEFIIKRLVELHG